MDEGAAWAGAIYDEIGRTYAGTRRPDPRVEAAIHGALGDAASVVNVGAGVVQPWASHAVRISQRCFVSGIT